MLCCCKEVTPEPNGRELEDADTDVKGSYDNEEKDGYGVRNWNIFFIFMH